MSTAIRIRRAIEGLGLNISEAAELLGINRVNLSHVLNGRAGVSVRLAVKIEENLGLCARVLLINQLDDQLEKERECRGH